MSAIDSKSTYCFCAHMHEILKYFLLTENQQQFLNSEHASDPANPAANCVILMRSYGNHSHTKIAPLVTKITYIKMDPLRSIRNGFVNPAPTDSHFYAAWTSRHILSSIDLPWPSPCNCMGNVWWKLTFVCHGERTIAPRGA